MESDQKFMAWIRDTHVVTVSYYKCCRPNQHFTSNQWLSHLTWNIVLDFKNVCCATNMQFIFNTFKMF